MSQTASPAPRGRMADALAVYLKRRVLIVLLLGFSSGLPLVLTSSTLQAWMTQSGVDVRTIGLFAAVAFPYTFKFLWAPLVDSLDVPVLSRKLGRRRGWLLFTQLWLIAAIILLGLCDPLASVLLVAVGAVFVAVVSATQDIVIDAFRVESLAESEQAAGQASYVAAYRVGMLIAGAGTLFLVAALRYLNLDARTAWAASYVVMAALILVGVVATLLATEPQAPLSAAGLAVREQASRLSRIKSSAINSFRDFLSHNLAVAVLVFVALFKLADALAFTLQTNFLMSGLGFSLAQVAAVRNGVGFIATVLGGFVGGFIARALPLSLSLWIGAILQTTMIVAFCWQAIVGMNLAVLTLTTTIEFFTDSIGTVIFVAYLSVLCRNPLYTATQFALLNALATVGRNVVSLGSGYLEHATGWVSYFLICAASGIPALAMLAWLQSRGHFDDLGPAKK